MENKDKMLLGVLIVVIIAASLVAITIESEQNKNKDADFGAFTLSVPHDSEFQQVDDKNASFFTKYQDSTNGITVLHMNSSFIEETVQNSTGNTINFNEQCINYLEQKDITKLNESSNNKNIAFYSYKDFTQQDYAGIYGDDNQMIIIEGPDLDLVKNITQSIKIK